MRANCLTLLAFIISQTVFSQSAFKEGKIVSNNGDTLRGMIDYRQWEINPDAIRFKNETDGTTKTYTVNDISYFEIPGADRYVRAVVRKDVRPVEMTELLGKNTIDTTLTDTVFLRTLVDSKIGLFQLEEEKSHFYIRDEQGEFHELLYKVYLVDADSRLSKMFIFRDQFNQWLPGNKSSLLSSWIAGAEYTEKDLTRIVEKMNEGSQSSFSYRVKKSKHPVSFYAGAGGVFSTFEVKGGESNIKKLEYTNSFLPAFIAGLDISIARNLQRLFLRFEVSWYSLKYEGSNHSKDPLNEYKLKVNSIMPSVSVLYHLINSTKHKVYIGTGLGVNFSSYPQNNYSVTNQFASPAYKETKDYMALEKVWMSLQARAGYIFNEKFEMAASMKYGGSFANFSLFGFKTPVNVVTVNYHFR